MTNAELLKNVWKTIYDPQINVKEMVERFFHPDYEQCINGVTMKRNEYIQHVIEQRKNIKIGTIDYKHMLEKDNELFALYYPAGTNIHNLPFEAEVIAYFRFENEQISRIHGIVRLIKGDFADLDMQKDN
ncbi:MAG TPA: hypothetical protein VKR58_07795 [Aquella sp.]|nr:hypothetical protein [Aquella sp.]